jgi:hypothetical protein
MTSKTLPEILTTKDAKGYTCHKNYSTWMPERFQKQAQADMVAIQTALSKLTKAELVTYLTTYHGTLPCQLWGTKRDNLVSATIKQYAVLYPQKETDWSDK